MSDFDNTAPEAVPFASVRWAACRVALTAGGTNPTTIANGSTVDGVTLATNDRFVCVGTRADAGIYVVGASNSARAADANTADEFVSPRSVRVTEGTSDNVGTWLHITSGAITLGSTALTFSKSIAQPETIPSSTFSNTAPTAANIAGTSFDNTGASASSIAASGWNNTGATAPSTGSSTTVYFGRSANATLTEAQAKSDLSTTTRTAAAGTYVCGATGYKYLGIPAAMTAPTTIKDNSTGYGIPLAGSGDGFGQTTNGLSHASVEIDGVSYRLYRSANQLGSEITLLVA